MKSTQLARRAAKRDANEPEIVRTLQQCGASVVRVSMSGVPDLLVGFGGRTYLVEIKSTKGAYTAEQLQFREAWRGGTPITLRSVESAVAWISRLTLDSEVES